MKKTLLIICLILIFDLFIIDFYSTRFVFYPAYISTRLDCSKELQELNQDIIAGSFNPSTNQIEINCNIEIDSLEYERVLKHEEKHRKQFLENRYYACDGLLNIGVFMNEVESKISEFL